MNEDNAWWSIEDLNEMKYYMYPQRNKFMLYLNSSVAVKTYL